MKSVGLTPWVVADLDALIEEIIVDAYGEDEQIWACRQACEDDVAPSIRNS